MASVHVRSSIDSLILKAIGSISNLSKWVNSQIEHTETADQSGGFFYSIRFAVLSSQSSGMSPELGRYPRLTS